VTLTQKTPFFLFDSVDATFTAVAWYARSYEVGWVCVSS
jgi:hypothetical protein